MFVPDHHTSFSEGAVHSEAQIAAEMIAQMTLRISKVYAFPLANQVSASVAVATAMAKFEDVVELMCTKQLARAVLANSAQLSLSVEESSRLLSYAATRSHPRATEAVAKALFKERTERIEKAISFTLAEISGTALWKLPLVQIACVLCTQGVAPPDQTLGAIFGSVVRSDLRRLEDLHESEKKDAMDTMLFAELIEIVSEAVSS